MPSSKNYKRDYQQENEYKKQPKQIAHRVERNKARQWAIDNGLASRGDGTQVDHIKPLSKGGKTTPSNLRVVSASTNDSFKRSSSGKLVSQSSSKERKRK